MPTTDKVANRLINEKSPYLLQHAYNPVDWYEWNDEAFAKAKAEDKAIFLSIGYSTCHWCHVMEKESFEDEEVAKLLNDNFIAIKVDREERPDIDSIYMSVCQAMTGSGGWPLTLLITPEKQPFVAGTYFPKHNKQGNTGLIEVLSRVQELWKTNKSKLVKSSNEILEHIKASSVNLEGKISKEQVNKAYKYFTSRFDPVFGGFGSEPKFPSPHNLNFLLNYFKATGEEGALDILKTTLDGMYKGGIFDHIGGGFSRYSTDQKWLVPHFEKMLYDNALLAITYVETFQVTKDELYREVAERTLDYVLRDMTSEEGGFYSAEDADSEGEEGKFYLWSKSEVEEVLNTEEQLFINTYGITAKGNFENKNILSLIGEEKTAGKGMENLREKLFSIREKRVHPHKDEKILTAWNGLMIVALCKAAKILKSDRYLKAAEKSLNFILKNLINEKGRLLARYCKGEAAYLGYLEDYAYLVWALIELYESTFNIKYLKDALKLNKDMLNYFWDEKEKGLFLYGDDGEQLILRNKEAYDAAIPSGNSIAAMNLLRLSRITEKNELEDKAKEIFNTFGGGVIKVPQAFTSLLNAFLYFNTGGTSIVIAGEKDELATEKILELMQQVYLPFSEIILQDGSQDVLELMPHLKGNTKIDEKATAYICKNYSCYEPTNNIEEIKEICQVNL